MPPSSSMRAQYSYADRSISSAWRSEEHTSELQSQLNLGCRLLLEKKNLQVICQPFVQNFQAIDFASDTIDLRKALAQIECFGFTFFVVAQQVLHLFSDGFAPGLVI